MIRQHEVGQLKTEEYAGHKIFFRQGIHSVEGQVNIDGIWYMIVEENKKEAYHKIKILIIDILKKGNYQKYIKQVESGSFNKFSKKMFKDRRWQR